LALIILSSCLLWWRFTAWRNESRHDGMGWTSAGYIRLSQASEFTAETISHLRSVYL